MINFWKSVQCKNAQNNKGPYLKKYFLEFIQKLIRSSTQHYQSIPRFKALALILRYFADKFASIFFQRAITQEKDTIL